MKVSLEIINELSPSLTQFSAEKIAEQLTLRSAEVETIEHIGAHLQIIRIAEVVAVQPHPEADRLKLVTFRVNNEERQVVCGAPNVRPGLHVAYAPVGATLPNGMHLEAKKIRGVLSEGMLCSEAELGIGEDSSGIWEVPDSIPLGATLAEALGTGTGPRSLLDIDNKSITHRADLWGHLGLAREISAILETPFKEPLDEEWENNIHTSIASSLSAPTAVSVSPDCACRAYFGISVDNVYAGESPQWLKQRLIDLGLRPINLLVDIGNYVMLETGAPLHFFDRNQIHGDSIKIYSLKEKTSLELLDGKIATLEPGDTVVADSDRPLVLAGIMGGLSSGVEAGTTSVFIEAASWDASWVRKCSSRLGLRTDSSVRFEKHLSTRGAYLGLLRAVELLLRLCPEATILGAVQSAGSEALTPPSVPVISLRPERVSAVLGVNLDAKACENYLNCLGCKTRSDKDSSSILVDVPYYRAGRDLKCEEDLIEEIGRLYGYNAIPVLSKSALIEPAPDNSGLAILRSVRNFLVYRGSALEIFTSPLIGKEVMEQAKWPEEDNTLCLLNALSSERDRMRRSLIPQMIEATALNARHFSHFRFFEIGRTYHPDAKEFSQENFHLGCVCFSRDTHQLTTLCQLTEELMKSLGYQCTFRAPKNIAEMSPKNWEGFHPTEALEVVVMGKSIGSLFSLHPRLTKSRKIRGFCAMLEIDLSSLLQRSKPQVKRFAKISTVPSAEFDVSIVAKKQEHIGSIIAASKKLKVPFVQNIQLLDIYGIDDELKSVTLRHTLHHEERTLLPDEISRSESMIIEGLKKAGYPLRQ